MTTVVTPTQARCAVVLPDQGVRLPEWVVDLASFHRWTASDDFPETGRISYLKGEVWIDMSEEQLFSHNQVKLEFFLVLGGLVKDSRLGRFFPDGARVSHPEADVSNVPDAVFVANESFRRVRVRLVEGAEEGYVRIEGSPDMVLEAVSTSSVQKDTDRLRELYWRAGIREYWLVDVRGERLEFDLLRHTAKGYAVAKKQGGWVKSAVFGKSFRLTRETDEEGHPEFTLSVR